jgi:hypothetical protein
MGEFHQQLIQAPKQERVKTEKRQSYHSVSRRGPLFEHRYKPIHYS